MPSRGIPYWRLSGFYFFYFAVVGTLSPYLGLYLQYLQFDALEIGTLIAALMTTRVLAPNVWGWLSDVTGQRMLLIRLGAMIAYFIFTAFFWGHDFWELLLIIVAFSFFWNAVLAPFEVVTLSHLQGRAYHYSRIRLWGSVGFIAAVFGLGWLFDLTNLSWFPVSVWILLGLIWVMTWTVSPKVSLSSQAMFQSQKLWPYLKQWPVLCFLLSGILLQFSFGSYYTFFSVYLETLGYRHVTIGALWSLGVVAEIVFFMGAHHFLSRFGLRSIMIFTLLVTALRWWLIGCYANLLGLMLVVQLLHAFSFGAAHAVSIEWIRRAFPGRVQGQGQALYSSVCFGVGGGCGALASGWLWDASPVLTFSVSALAAALATLLILFGMQGSDGIEEKTVAA